MSNRKKVAAEPVLKDWNEVDQALREIAEIDILTQEIVSGHEVEIQDLREQIKSECEPHLKRKARLEKDIEEFTEASRAEFDKQKTRFLTFGKVGFRQSTVIKLLKSAQEVIDRIKIAGRLDCLIVTEKVNKEAIRLSCSDEIIGALGCKKCVQDDFWYEVDREKVVAPE